MGKIYLVSEGSYSDYHICGVYSTKEKAEEAKKLFGSGSDIEEHDLDAIPDHPQGLYLYEVRMMQNGNCNKPETIDCGMGIGDNLYSHLGELITRMWSEDERHAAKIANERRAQLITDGWFEREEEKRQANLKRFGGSATITAPTWAIASDKGMIFQSIDAKK